MARLVRALAREAKGPGSGLGPTEFLPFNSMKNYLQRYSGQPLNYQFTNSHSSHYLSLTSPL